MKQTVEEAAMNFANYEFNNLDKLPFKVKVVVDYDNGLTRGFKSNGIAPDCIEYAKELANRP